MGNITFKRQTGNLGRIDPSDDGVSAMIGHGVATGSYTLNDVVQLNKLKDLEDLGIDKTYDSTNKMLVWHRVREFFRFAPGQTLFLMLVDASVTTGSLDVPMTDICDKDNDYLKKLLRAPSAEGKIRRVAVFMNPDNTYTGAYTSGIDDDVDTAIAKAQALVEEEFTYQRPVHVFLEGRGYAGAAATVVDLRGKSARNVSVVIGADPDVSGAETEYNDYAAVATALGVKAGLRIDENIGYVEKSNLTDTADSLFLKAGLSSNTLTGDADPSDLALLETKGYIYVKKYDGFDGVYFNDAHCCIAASDDYAYIEDNEVYNKAQRLLYQALVPKINKAYQVDPDTGYIAAVEAKALEGAGEKALEDNMAKNNEISGYEVYVDEKQDVKTTGKIIVQSKLVSTATGRELEVELGLALKL